MNNGSGAPSADCFVPAQLAERCAFVCAHANVCEGGGYVRYTQLVYCLAPALFWPAVGLCLLLLVQFFIALSVAADSFFCPCLAVIVDQLKISQNIAGVTLLAFGNGAPDIFSSVASVLSTDAPKPALAFGALLGAGVWLTTVIVALVTLVCPFDVMRRPLLRDIGFYLCAIGWTFYVLAGGQIALWHAVVFVAMYAVYALVVALGRYVRTRVLRPAVDTQVSDNDVAVVQPSVNGLRREDSFIEEATWRYDVFHDAHESQAAPDADLNAQSSSDKEYLTEGGEALSIATDLWTAVRPFSALDWQTGSTAARFVLLAKAPLVVMLAFTIPLLDPTADKHNWCKPLALLQCVLCPLVVLFSVEGGATQLGGRVPLWAMLAVCGVLLAALLNATTERRRPPALFQAAPYAGFAMAVVWIYSLAREVVGVVIMVGAVFNVSSALLGLTLLAWSNSLGDLIADLSVARQGFPRMAISACFGGPLFNLLVGVGVAFSIATLRDGHAIHVDFTPVSKVLLAFLSWSLLSSLVLLPLTRFHASRPYAAYLIVVYVTFLVTAILSEKHVIRFPF